MLLLASETTLHNCCAQIPEDTPGFACFILFILGFRAFAGKAGGDVVFCAKLAGLVVGIDGVATETLHVHSGKLLLIFNALLYTDTFIESLKTMVLDKGYAVNLYVVDFRSELNPLVFFASYHWTDVWAVYTDDTVFDLLVVVVVGLLPQDLPYRHQSALLICCKMDCGLELAAQPVPLCEKLCEQ